MYEDIGKKTLELDCKKKLSFSLCKLEFGKDRSHQMKMKSSQICLIWTEK